MAYYERKRENFDYEDKTGWTDKQVIIDQVIRKYKPTTFFDIGCNTGWFSVLAARHGCQVVAADIDEACVNQLYLNTKRHNYRILPLVFDVFKYPQDAYSVPYKKEKADKKISYKLPLLQSADKRLRCDMVLVLALIHHLVLGQNYSFAQVVEIINRFSKKYLVLEFVLLEDDLIQKEPEFFPAYNNLRGKFKFYNLGNLLLELKRYYKKVVVKNSSLNTRKILICIK